MAATMEREVGKDASLDGCAWDGHEKEEVVWGFIL